MNNAHQLTRASILLAFYTVILLITLYVPILGSILVLFLPVPFIIFSAKNNFKSTIVFFVGAVLLSLIVGGPRSILFTFTFGMTGITMGYLLQKQKGRWITFLIASMVFLINLVLMYVTMVIFFKLNFIEEFIKIAEESLTSSVKMVGSLGQTPNTKVIEQMQASILMMETLIPSVFVMMSFMMVFFIQLVSVPILKRFDISVSDWKPFRELELPKSILYYYLISLALSIFANPEVGSYLYAAVSNLVFVLQLFMVVQGISFVFFYSHAKGFAKSFPIVAVVLAFFLPFLLYLVRILGIIDLGFNLRKRLDKGPK